MLATFGSSAFSAVFSSMTDAGTATAAALGLLLLLGACGKSAQFPLQSWLLDAMEGPTPVSALIHAATMVTAGVYLVDPVVRCSTPPTVARPGGRGHRHDHAADRCDHRLREGRHQEGPRWFDDEPDRLRMMLAAGLGPVGAAFAIFHLLTHGFFKANMFLGAGSVMHGMHDEVNMRRYGGLRKLLPVTFATFAIGYLAIIGIPPFAGFWSKDKIIEAAFSAERLVRALRAARCGRDRVLHDPPDDHDLRRRIARAEEASSRTSRRAS